MASHILTFMMIPKLKFLRFQLEIFIHIFGGWVKGTSDKKIGSMVAQNVEQVQYLKSIVTGNRLLELTAPALLNLFCFSYNRNLNDEEKLNALK